MAESFKGDQINVVRKREPEVLNIVLSRIISDALSLTGKPSDETVAFIGRTIKESYWYFRLGELARVIQKGIKGYYGNVPSGVNPILFWCKVYDEGEREQYCVSQNLVHKESYEKAHEELIREENRQEMKRVKTEMKKIRAVNRAKENLNLLSE